MQPSRGERGGRHPLHAGVPSTMEGRGPGACLGLCASPLQQLGPHKALGFNLIYQLLPDDLIYPPLCQSVRKSLTCAQSRPTFPTTDLMSHTCPRPSLSEDNSPSSPNLTIHPPPQPGPGLMNSHNHTLIQSHTHTHTHMFWDFFFTGPISYNFNFFIFMSILSISTVHEFLAFCCFYLQVYLS